MSAPRTSHATVKLSCTVLDRTKPLAPVWRSNCEKRGSLAYILWLAGLMAGNRAGFRWSKLFLKPQPSAKLNSRSEQHLGLDCRRWAQFASLRWH